VRLIENEGWKDTTNVRSLCLGLRATTSDNVLVINGDLFFGEYIFTKFDFNSTSVLVTTEFGQSEVGVVDENETAQHFSYGLEKKWSQIAYIKNGDIECLEAFCFQPKNWTKCLFEALNFMILNNVKISTRKTPDFVCDIDNKKDWELVNGKVQ